MASSIDASTSGPGGVITTADNSGILNLQSGGNTVATINSSGLQVTTLNSSTVPTAAGTVMVSGNMPAFSVYYNSTMSLTAGTNTKVNFNIKEFDTANCYDNTTNYRFTPNVAGYYCFTGSMGVTTTTGTCIIAFYKNGSIYKYGGAIASSSTSYPFSVGTVIVYMNGTTDYMELYVQSTVAGASSWSGASANNYFQGFMVRAA